MPRMLLYCKVLLVILLTTMVTLASVPTDRLDSLKQVIESHLALDTAKVNLSISIGVSLRQTNPRYAVQLAEESYDLSRQLGYIAAQAASFKLMADGYQYLGKYDTSLVLYDSAALLFKELEDMDGYIGVLNNMGISHFYKSNYPKALECYNTCLDIRRMQSDSTKLINAYGNIGMIHSAQGNYSAALESFFHVLMLEAKYNNSQRVELAYDNIGETYLFMGELSLAKFNMKKSLRIYRAKNKKIPELLTLIGLGNVYVEEQALDSALICFEEVRVRSHEIGAQSPYAQSLQRIGQVYKLKRAYDKALPRFNKALTIYRQIGSRANVALALNDIGEVLLSQKRYDGAEEAFLESKGITHEIGDKLNELKAVRNLIQLYHKREEYKTAFDYQEWAGVLKDSLFNEQKSKQIIEIRNRYEFENSKHMLETKKLQLAITESAIIEKETRLKIELYILYVVVFVTLSALGLYYVHIKYYKLKNEKKMLTSNIILLKNQLSPHFLFNSLNVLSTLVHKSATKADHFINHLAKLYRYILDNIDNNLVTVHEELEFAKAYFDILAIRFDDKIKINIGIDPNLNDCYIPPLSLQTLLENAVKHNSITSQNPLVLDITNVQSKYILVKNNLNKKPMHPTNRLGLRNLRFVYTHLTHKEIIIIEDRDFFKIYIPVIITAKNESAHY